MEISGPDGGVTPGEVSEAYGAGRLAGRVGRRWDPLEESGGGGTSTEQVRAKHCRPEPQGARQSPDKDRVKTWSEHEASDHTGGSATRH